jgi:arylsulfatase A-like enzyme
LPYTLRAVQQKWGPFSPQQIRGIQRAFYALCTHIDHQLRLVIGTLREEQILDNTIILFTADHGDMLGNHGLWAKRLYYEQSANVPMLLVGVANDARVGHHRIDNRLVGWQDVMPTLLDLAGIPIPEHVEGISMVGQERRTVLYGECGEDSMATRMVHDGRHKLIYYPLGNHIQLFDLESDPNELEDLAGEPAVAEVQQALTEQLITNFYGSDLAWVKEGVLVGAPDRDFAPRPDRGLSGQRGIHWPPPPLDNSGRPVGAAG